jgi:hypothetical protein
MLLAPDIQEAILEGRQPKGMQLEELTVSPAETIAPTQPTRPASQAQQRAQ